MVKSPGKKISKLFCYYGVVKFRRNLNFEKMDTVSYTEKNDGVMRKQNTQTYSNKILL